jgi:hypothetical protein
MVRIECDKLNCAYNEGGICENDDIELVSRNVINSDNNTTGKYLTCYSFELHESHNNRAVNAAAPSAGARHDGQSTDGERADNR